MLRRAPLPDESATGKIIRVIGGEVWDVAVDLRRSSPTFKKWAGVRLSDDNKRMLWIPPGFGHGFVVLSERVDFLYKTGMLFSISCAMVSLPV